MSYASRESSDHDARPVELYRFTEGTRKWLYTSSDAAVVYQTETYEPRPLKRGAFRQTSELNKATLEINAPRDLPLAGDAFASPLVGVIALTIYRQHRGDGETVTWWKGRVSGMRASGGEITITCEPLATALKRIGLRRPAQRQCPHALYDAGCTVSQAAFSATGTLLSNAGATVTASAFGAKPNGWWVGGKIILNGAPRFVIGHTGDTVTISSAVPNLPQNAAFTVYAGCDRTPATCNGKFGNIMNYGGAPWFPIKNPFTGDSAA